MARRSVASMLFALLLLACGGEEFTVTGSGGAPSGGTAGAATGGTGFGGGTGGSGGIGGAGALGGTSAGGVGGSSGSGGAAGAACGPGSTTGLLFYSTLDDANAIAQPSVGSGTYGFATDPVDDFVPGVCGNGLRLDGAGDYLALDEAASFDIERGTIDFWYLPSSAQDDGVLRRFVYTSGPPAALPGLSIRKTDLNIFTANVRDVNGVYVGSEVTSFSFVPGTWIRITVTWDVNATDQVARIYFDGVEASYSLASPGPLTVTKASPGAQMLIGASDTSGTASIAGVLDELRIYAQPSPP